MTTLEPTENGPCLLSGVDAVARMTDGRFYEVEGHAAPCRCGGFRNKPFCNGDASKQA